MNIHSMGPFSSRIAANLFAIEPVDGVTGRPLLRRCEPVFHRPATSVTVVTSGRTCAAASRSVASTIGRNPMCHLMLRAPVHFSSVAWASYVNVAVAN